MKTVTVIVTDKGFLVPSLALANSIAVGRLASLTDVMVFLVDVDPEIRSRLAASDLGKRLELVPLDSRQMGVSDVATFRPGHVPRTAMGRLAIYNHVPVHYRNVIYMDGDMQIVGDASPLFRYTVPAGRIAAGVEHFVLFGQDPASRPGWLNQYLDSISLSSPDQYFNSGLLAFQRDTWQELGARALRFFNDHSELCRHHDQTALNAVCRGEWLPLSPAYNYQSFFMPVHHKIPLTMKIAHFTSSPKPWASSKSLWPPVYAHPYREFLTEFPFLDAYMKPLYTPNLLERVGVSRLKRLRSRMLNRDQIARRSAAFNAYLKRTDFVVQ